MKTDTLQEYCQKVLILFPELSGLKTTSLQSIRDYYNHSFIGYTLFHHRQGAIHMAISQGNKIYPGDYRVQAQEAINLAKRIDTKGTFAELGCGRGFNIGIIAKALTDWTCIGVDLNKKHLQAAQKSLLTQKNCHFLQDDFHKLQKIPNHTLDLILCVECLCHSFDINQVAKAMHKKLKPTGQIIIFDGFTSSHKKTSTQRLAASLVEKAMAVPRFYTIHEFEKAFRQAGFSVADKVSLTPKILPNVLRLSFLARAFFKVPIISRLLVKMLPRYLVYNAAAALLMPATFGTGIHCYYKIHFKACRR